MNRPNAVRAFFLALTLLATSGVGRAGAQDEDQDQAAAKERFQRGVAAYEAGQYGEALADFQEAYRLKPHPLVRVNIANCYDKLDRPVEAVFHFEQFMSSKHGSPEQRAEIKAALKELHERIGKLALTITPDGARVTIDESVERRAPVLEPITLKAGLHEVVVALEGYDTLRRSVDVLAGTTTEISLSLTRPAASPMLPLPITRPLPEPIESEPEPVASEPEPVAQQPAPEAAVQAAPPARERVMIPLGVWIAGGASLVLATAGTITGILASAAEQDFEDNVRERFDPTLSATDQQLAWIAGNDAADRADTLALTTDVLFGAAIVSAGVAVYLYVTHDPDEASAALKPLLTPNGAAISARF